MLTSPSTVRLALLACLVVAVTGLTACGDRAGQAIGAAVPRKATGPAAHLMAENDAPSGGSAWRKIRTTDSDDVVAPCHLTSLVDIGALEVSQRTWSVRKGSTPISRQVVARFADNKSAWRAHQVLDSWHGDCGDRRAGTVEARVPVDVPTGNAEEYRVVTGNVATAIGILRKGEYLSVFSLTGPALVVTGRQSSEALGLIANTF
ncbi:MAG: hypothetical protein ABIO16_09585 [Nocardioides sp.]